MQNYESIDYENKIIQELVFRISELTKTNMELQNMLKLKLVPRHDISDNYFTDSSILKVRLKCHSDLKATLTELKEGYDIDPIQIGGYFIWPSNCVNMPYSELMFNILKNNLLYKSNVAYANTVASNCFIQSMTSMRLKPLSKYKINVVKEANFKDQVLSAIKSFVQNVDRILDSTCQPEQNIGIFKQYSFSDIELDRCPMNLMESIGHHYTSFERCLKFVPYTEHCDKTLSRILKAYNQLFQIASYFYGDNLWKEIIEYIGDWTPNDIKQRSSNFLIRFQEGFFAEGKSTKITSQNGCPEFEHFIRGKTIKGYTLLDMPNTCQNENILINCFLNYASYVAQSLKIYNIVRLGIDDPTGAIYVDRGMFSRIYFSQIRHQSLHNHVYDFNKIVRQFTTPLCLYFDMIQSLFHKPIRVRFVHDYNVNTMLSSYPSWRLDASRNMERLLFPTKEIECEKRQYVYNIIYYDLPSIINAALNCKLIYSDVLEYVREASLEKTPLVLDLAFGQFMKEKCEAQANEILLKSDWIKKSFFASFITRFYTHLFQTEIC
jgi:hypothetical protein